MRINHIIMTAAALFINAGIMAQTDDEGYRMEVGPAFGGCFYMGDASPATFYNHTNGMAGVVARWNFNPRWSLKGNLCAAGIEGDTRDREGTFPSKEIHFSRTIWDMGVQLEVGFWGYSTAEWNGCHRFAPYYTMGVGTTFAGKPLENVWAANFPVGVGFRYKIAERINIGFEWTMRFSTSDKLDVTESCPIGLEDPFMVKGKGFKNKDSYSFTSLSVTFDLLRRKCNCNNDKQQ